MHHADAILGLRWEEECPLCRRPSRDLAWVTGYRQTLPKHSLIYARRLPTTPPWLSHRRDRNGIGLDLRRCRACRSAARLAHRRMVAAV
jgi:hypothetical protein